MNNYRNSASSSEYLNKKTLSKKHISERNSFGSDFVNIENENNSANKKNIIIYKNKNNSNLYIIQKSKLDPFTYGKNNENLISLKKANYTNNFFIITIIIIIIVIYFFFFYIFIFFYLFFSFFFN